MLGLNKKLESKYHKDICYNFFKVYLRYAFDYVENLK